ncbi:hypothetical protein [Aeromonas sp. EERV15]|uniref:hypothetical protein n=1 Tax=Aeromonas sp. EERV15 TaxID=1833892 RepID=UPI00083B027D|nr:hypothetical protein [Aeromonas sp. EERV15]
MSILKISSIAALSLALGVSFAATSIQAAPATADADVDGIPDMAETVLATDPMVADTDGDGLNDKADPKPLEAANPIAQNGKTGGPLILAAKVEDNFDPSTKKDIPDHLEISLKNPGASGLQGLQVYYTIKDTTSGKTESYYRNLTSFKLAAGTPGTLHFDVKGSVDSSAATEHFRVNPNSLLYKSPNAKSLTIQVAAAGYAPSTLTIKKDAGGEEKAD